MGIDDWPPFEEWRRLKQRNFGSVRMQLRAQEIAIAIYDGFNPDMLHGPHGIRRPLLRAMQRSIDMSTTREVG